MNTSDCKEFLITLNASPGLEESLVDSLLAFASTTGFSSVNVDAHDHNNANYSLVEQVTGRQKKIRFQMYVSKQDLPRLLDKLKEKFTGSGIQYWVLPIVDSGCI